MPSYKLGNSDIYRLYLGSTLIYGTNPVEENQPAAPILQSAVLSGSDYVLTFSQPGLQPDGGWDTFIDDVDQNDRDSHSGLTRTITGLNTAVDHSFKIEARYTQLQEPQFLQSNSITVSAQTVNATAVTVSPATYDLQNGSTIQLSVAFTPSNTTDKTGVWSSNNESVATVNSSGLVTNVGVDTGTATITFTSNDGSFTDTCVITAVEVSQQPLKAFPTAYGAGSNVTGGRGKPVYYVTNLNESGAGSFYQTLIDTQATNGGIVLFACGGDIVNTGTNPKYVDNLTNVTIAGQTASGGGITVAGQKWVFKRASNVIMRYIRFRPQYDIPTNEEDAFYINGCNDMIIDHCSFSWGADEVFSIVATLSDMTVNNVTVQRCIIGEGKTASIFGDSNEPDKNNNLSYLNNMNYNISHRFPNINCGWVNGSGETVRSGAEIINNLVFNYYTRLSEVYGDMNLNYIGNYIDSGLHTINNTTVNLVATVEQTGRNPKIYTSGNVATGWLSADGDQWDIFRQRDKQEPYGETDGDPLDEATYRELTQFPLLGNAITIQTAVNARLNVLNDVGCNYKLDKDGNKISNIDAVDTVYLNNASNQTPQSFSRDPETFTSEQHYIDYQANKGSNNTTTPNYTDTSGDGMPDDWKTAKGLTPATDDSSYEWASGYIGVEEYLNEVDG